MRAAGQDYLYEGGSAMQRQFRRTPARLVACSLPLPPLTLTPSSEGAEALESVGFPEGVRLQLRLGLAY
jgi:hypothetical protein